MQLLMSALGAVIMVSICGLGAFFIVADERRGHNAEAAEVPVAQQVVPRDISSRAVDPRPLSTAEVFPRSVIVPAPGTAAYRVEMTHIDTDCRVATTGNLGPLLDGYGCSQFVRATLTAPTAGYVVTAGIFNLADQRGANAAHERIKPLVDSGAGTFAGMAAGPGTAPVALPSAQVGWHVRGHYLVYCVIARPDGRIIADDDPNAQRIIFDMIESHLRDGVIGRRAVAPAASPAR
jgi:hypothetical protein